MPLSSTLQTVLSASHTWTHSALTCPDIIFEIIEQTYPSDDSQAALYNHRKVLATLALVCKMFNVPATKALWRRLDSFLPLILLFSAFGEKESMPDLPANHMISAGDLLPHEISRFRELGSFVQAIVLQGFECGSGFSNYICIGSWNCLKQLSASRPLFPSLQELHWFVPTSSSTELLFVAPPSLRRLKICYNGNSRPSPEWKQSQEALFRTLFEIAPHLTHLTFCDIHEDILPACLSHAHSLRVLILESFQYNISVDFDALRAMSTLESLEELSYALYTSEDAIDFSGFSALKRLDIYVLSGSPRVILCPFSSPNLRELTLTNHSDGTNLNYDTVTFERLAQSFPAMEVLTWLSRFQDGTRMDALLAPLLTLRNLMKVSLKLFGQLRLTLDDDFFTTLAESLPRLVELFIMAPSSTANSASERGSVTPRTLLAFARTCPRLQKLWLPYVQSPWLEEVGEYPVLQHGLRSLGVDQPELESLGEGDLQPLSMVLDKFFPYLETAELLPGYHTRAASSDAWPLIMSGVQRCRQERMHRPTLEETR